MALPPMPSRPQSHRPTGSLVSSRLKAFGSMINASPPNLPTPKPSLPTKPKSGTEPNRRRAISVAPASTNVHQVTHNLETLRRVAGAMPQIPACQPKVEQRRSSSAAVEFVANAASDISVKDIKSKFENTTAAVRFIDRTLNHAPQATSDHSNLPRPISIRQGNVESSDDMNNNVKAIRAELESKLTLTPPNASSPPHRSNSMHGRATAVRHSLQQFPNEPAASSAFPGGGVEQSARTSVYEDRPALPTLSAKSKPPPRPPPCSQTSKPPQQRRDYSGPVEVKPTDAYGGQKHLAPISPSWIENSRSPSPQESWALVSYDFVGEQSDEITSKHGDKLILKHEVDDEWYYAYNTRTCRTGIIPKAFLTVKVPLPSSRHTNLGSDEDSGVESAGNGPRCYTLHDFMSNVSGDLSFLKGEVIKIVTRVNDDWLEGESHDGRRGIFPVSFVEIIEDLPTIAKQPDAPVVVAVYDFIGEKAGDLSCKAGERISVLARVSSDWLYGVNLVSNQVGIFPSTFVDHSPPDLPFYYSTQ